MVQPPPHLGMRHIALQVVALEACVQFYTELLGMHIEWQPDKDNVYLTSHFDNLALHRLQASDFPGAQHLDHFGFILKAPEDVDTWHDFLLSHGVIIKSQPKTHRDGARSFYCEDPDGNTIQMIFHPPLAHL